MSDRDDILADRLNVEPAIFKGCSSSELGMIVGVAALIWLPVSLLLAGLMGAVTMGFGLAGVGVVATVIVMASLFQRLKRGRPDGQYQQRFSIWLSDHGLRPSPFIRRSGFWDIGRSRNAVGCSPASHDVLRDDFLFGGFSCFSRVGIRIRGGLTLGGCGVAALASGQRGGQHHATKKGPDSFHVGVVADCTRAVYFSSWGGMSDGATTSTTSPSTSITSCGPRGEPL